MKVAADSTPDGWTRCETPSGKWLVDWQLEPLGLEPRALFDHGLFDLRARVARSDGAPLGEDVELRVDAGMPQHRHGMNVVPTVEREPGNQWRVNGLLFHMPGEWTLTFDVTDGALTERAQCVLSVD